MLDEILPIFIVGFCIFLSLLVIGAAFLKKCIYKRKKSKMLAKDQSKGESNQSSLEAPDRLRKTKLKKAKSNKNGSVFKAVDNNKSMLSEKASGIMSFELPPKDLQLDTNKTEGDQDHHIANIGLNFEFDEEDEDHGNYIETSERAHENHRELSKFSLEFSRMNGSILDNSRAQEKKDEANNLDTDNILQYA